LVEEIKRRFDTGECISGEQALWSECNYDVSTIRHGETKGNQLGSKFTTATEASYLKGIAETLDIDPSKLSFAERYSYATSVESVPKKLSKMFISVSSSKQTFFERYIYDEFDGSLRGGVSGGVSLSLSNMSFADRYKYIPSLKSTDDSNVHVIQSEFNFTKRYAFSSSPIQGECAVVSGVVISSSKMTFSERYTFPPNSLNLTSSTSGLVVVLTNTSFAGRYDYIPSLINAPA